MAKMDFKNFAQTIIVARDADLALRNRLISTQKLSDGYNPEMEALHNKHAEELDQLIDIYGFPSVDKVGHESSEAAWLIIQHAIGKPKFMRKCLLLLQQAVVDQKANPIHLAYLSDRIAVLEGNPQLYGTQFDWDEDGLLSPNKYDDINLVNERRANLGLNSLEKQTILMRERTRKENQSPPLDLAKRKEEYLAWRKKVGWDIL
jgi:hypothetical protein